ncbi:hypothetical protein [Vineibacter terrae]|uniref:hypothetical protein n=1 Tax=Vineibacter terrae TaxID=2586908 RepID=UPI002E358B07|nr:hypothetical protein [Vineibacter terrae]HEX2891428.1 hypothetical protein [Vineibacter terrae]
MTVNLDAGDMGLEISSDEHALTFHRIDRAAFVCLDSLINGSPLQAAMEGALLVDPLFDVVPVLRSLLSRGFITDVRAYPSLDGDCS